MNRTVTFVIGATASGKTTFINNHFSENQSTVKLNIYDYQQAAYKELGNDKFIPFEQARLCLHRANKYLLLDIIKALQEDKNVVVEQTLYKAKRRISYIDIIRNEFKDIFIEIYVMCPSDSVWNKYINERKLDSSVQRLKSNAKEIEFPNVSEGFDKIYEVIDGNIRLRMDASKPEIIDAAHKELAEEAQQMEQKKEKDIQRLELIESMNFRPFWHYCEVCGTKIFCTAQEAFETGWDYPPKIGTFGLLGPRTCGNCLITDTLFFRVYQQENSIVIERNLTEKEAQTWQRIKNEPESLLEPEK